MGVCVFESAQVRWWCANFKDLAVCTFPVQTMHILVQYPNYSNSAQLLGSENTPEEERLSCP